MIEYYSSEGEIRNVDGFQFWVPQGIKDSMTLFSEFGVGFSAPNGYFGENWDAFEDCLLDLQWISQLNVVIIHRDVPKLPDEYLSIYFDILRCSIDAWEDKKTNELHREFPEYVPHRLRVFFRNDL